MFAAFSTGAPRQHGALRREAEVVPPAPGDVRATPFFEFPAASATRSGLAFGWQGRLREVADFLRAHRRPPRWRGRNLSEKYLRQWLNMQQRRQRAGRPSPPLEGDLTEQMQISIYDEHWHARCSQVASVIRTQSRLPYWSTDNFTEWSLRAWLSTQQQRLRANRLSTVRKGWLDDKFLDVKRVLEGNASLQARISMRDRHWHAKSGEVSALMRSYGRLPHWSDRSPLRSWLNKQFRRYREGRLSPEQSKWLEAKRFGGKHALEGSASRQLQTDVHDAHWHAKWSAVESFVRVHGRLPLESKQNNTERTLYMRVQKPWYMYHRRRGPPPSQRSKWLKDQYPDVKHFLDSRTRQLQIGMRDEHWHAKCSEVATFIRTNGRLPRSSDRNLAGSSLREWLNTQRRRYLTGMLSPQCIEWLGDKFVDVKRFFEGTLSQQLQCSVHDEHWHDKCSEVASFMRTYGRLPYWSDHGLAENELRKWLNAQQRLYRARKLSPVRKGWLDDKFLAVKRVFDGNESLQVQIGFWDEHWHAKCSEAASFIGTHGRLPRWSDHALRGGPLRKWLNIQQQRYQEGRLSPQRIEWLDDKFIDVKQFFEDTLSRQSDEYWHDKCSEVASFIHTYRRLPRSSGRNHTFTERRLRLWLEDQRRRCRAGRLSPQCNKWLDDNFIVVKHFLHENLSQRLHCGMRDQRWHDTCSEVESFIQINARLPSWSDRDLAENSLRQWLSIQQRRYHARRLSSVRNGWLDGKFLEVKRVLEGRGSLQIRDMHWHAKCSEVTSFIRTYGRLPRKQNRNFTERNLRKWLDRQQLEYRAGNLSLVYKEWLNDQFLDVKRILEDNSSQYLEISAADEQWLAKCSEVAYFIRTIGRLPRHKIRAEGRLRMWLLREQHRYRAGKMSHVRRKWLKDEFTDVKHALEGNFSPDLPICNVSVELKIAKPDERWHTKCSEVASFIRTYGRVPRWSNSNLTERYLCEWLKGEQHRYRARKLSAVRNRWLDDKFLDVRYALEGTAPPQLQTNYRLLQDDEDWHAKCSEVASFIRIYGRFPRWSDRNSGEFSHGWLKKQKERYRAGILSPVRIKWLDEQFPDVKNFLEGNTSQQLRIGVADEHWRSKCSEVASFIRTYGRCPSISKHNPTESSLREWLNLQRRLCLAGTLSTERKKWLDEKCLDVKGFVDGSVSIYWHTKCSEVASFIRTCGRLPRWSRSNNTEWLLRKWLQDQRQSYLAGKLSPKHNNLLNTKFLDVRSFFDGSVSVQLKVARRDDDWHTTCSEVASFIHTCGRLPRWSASNHTEKHLRRWLQNQRRSYRAGSLPAQRSKWLDADFLDVKHALEGKV